MKHLKMLGIAAASSCVLLLAIGAGGASAAICSGSGTGSSCGAGYGNIYQGPFSATLTEFAMTSTLDNMVCNSGTVSGSITNGEKGTLNITGVTYSGCTDSFGNSCTITSNASATNIWAGRMQATTAPNGTVEDEFQLHFACGNQIACTYRTVLATGTVTGGSSPSMQFSKVGVTRESPSNFGCTSSARFSATYKITTPSTLYLV